MKKITVFSLLLVGLVFGAHAATTQQRRGASTPAAATASAQTKTNTQKTTAARAAVRGGTTKASVTPANTQKTTTARAAVRGNTVKTTPAATAPTKTIAARAATMNKAVGGAPKTSPSNAVRVDENCQQKYESCMDSFCVLAHTTGGRCRCSDKYSDYAQVKAGLEQVDKQSYAMATSGLERLEMGQDADIVIDKAKDVADIVTGQKKVRSSLVDMASATKAAGDADIFAAATEKKKTISDMIGSELYNASHDLCVTRIPECVSDIEVSKLLYMQKVKADCASYENDLKKQLNNTDKKLNTAEKALREAALEQHQSANKWDLGQCTVEFRNCMATTGGCGADFSKCASGITADGVGTVASAAKAKSKKTHTIKGTSSSIDISVTTWDTLLAKKPLCEHITKSCQLVADQVWDAFLRDAAPQIKSAELVAENDTRQNCVASVSDCFHNSCRDTMDPADPDGSYDLCLSRPEAMLTVCKIPLEACGVDTSSVAKASKSIIWQYVNAVLASMRVDACTTQFKDCLRSNDRCGKDYSLCAGMDVNTVRSMCPLDKLVACQKDGKSIKSIDELNDILVGIYLDIDNNMFETCRNAVELKMLEVCGDLNNCYISAEDTILGTDSLATQRASNGDYVIDGLISFGNLKTEMSNNANTSSAKKGDIAITYTIKNVVSGSNADVDAKVKKRVNNTLNGIAQEANRQIAMFTSDPQIAMCLNGRDLSQIKGDGAKRSSGRFPHLMDFYADIILRSVLNTARSNYEIKYAQMLGDATSASDALRNTIYCNSMGLGGTHLTEDALKDKKKQASKLGDLLGENNSTGISEVTDYSVRIKAGSDKAVLEAMAANNSRDDVILDNEGEMIGKRMIRANYELGTKNCIITTETMACIGFEAIYNTKTTTLGVSAGVNANVSASWDGQEKEGKNGKTKTVGGGSIGVGGGINGGAERTEVAQTYAGHFCNNYAEPVVSEQIIHLGSAVPGADVEQEVASARQNSSVRINQNISNTNINSTSLGISLSGSTGNIGGNYTNTDLSNFDGKIDTLNSGIIQNKTTNKSTKVNVGSAVNHGKAAAPAKTPEANPDAAPEPVAEKDGYVVNSGIIQNKTKNVNREINVLSAVHNAKGSDVNSGKTQTRSLVDSMDGVDINTGIIENQETNINRQTNIMSAVADGNKLPGSKLLGSRKKSQTATEDKDTDGSKKAPKVGTEQDGEGLPKKTNKTVTEQVQDKIKEEIAPDNEEFKPIVNSVEANAMKPVLENRAAARNAAPEIEQDDPEEGILDYTPYNGVASVDYVPEAAENQGFAGG